jgi:hypothetical protein
MPEKSVVAMLEQLRRQAPGWWMCGRGAASAKACMSYGKPWHVTHGQPSLGPAAI